MSYLIFTKNGPEIPYKLPENSEQQVIVGRANECDISIKSNKLSRKHCRIFIKDGSILIEDYESANGTYVNSKKISVETKLNPGDYIKIGDTLAQFSLTTELIKNTKEVKANLNDIPHLKLEFAPEDAVIPGIIQLQPGEHYLGRKNLNDIVLNYKSVSSKHCKIIVSDTKVLVEDLGSTNGTRINGKKISEPTEIKPGNMFQIEKLKFKFHWKKFETDKPTITIAKRDFDADDSKTPVEELKLMPADSESYEIKLEEPDDIGFEYNLDDVHDTNQQKVSEKVFTKDGHSAEIDESQSASIEMELQQEVDEFIKDVKKGKSFKAKFFIAIQALIIMAVIAVAIFIITSNAPKDIDSESDVAIIEPPGDSLITKNWSFEEVLPDESIDLKNWIPAGPDSDNPYRFIDTSLSRGQACLLMDRISQTMQQTECYYEEPIKVTASKKYYVGAKIRKLEGRGSGGVKIYFYKDSNAQQFLSSIFAGDFINTVSDDWKDYKAQITVPESAKSATVSLVVFGGISKFLFDDIVLKPLPEVASTPPDVLSIAEDDIEVVFKADGTFKITEQDGNLKNVLFEQAQWVLVDNITKDVVSIADFTKDMKMSEFTLNNKPGIKAEGILLSPVTETPGAQIPYSLLITFDETNQVVFKFKFELPNPYKFGLMCILPDVNKKNAWARFKKEFSEIKINFHQRLPIKDGTNSPYVFDALTSPLTNKHIKFDSTTSAKVKAGFIEDSVQMLLQQEGETANFTANMQVETDEFENLKEFADSAENRGEIALAIAQNYNLLLQTIYSPIEIKKNHRRIIRLCAKIFENQEEFTRILRNVENNPSALLFNQAITLGQELRKILGDEEFQKINPNDSKKYVLPGEEQFYLNEIRLNLTKLKKIPEQIKTFEEKYRGKIDYAFLLRAEVFTRIQLARALDYLDNEDDFLAISFFLQIIQKYPLSRPATIARTRLLDIANKYVMKAEELSETEAELSNQYRALVVKICNNITNNEFLSASSDKELIWDTELNTWSKRSAEIINSFYSEVGTQPEEQWQKDWKEKNELDPESTVDPNGEPWWWLWDVTFWEQKEKTARTIANDILRTIESKIDELPTPTELPE